MTNSKLLKEKINNSGFKISFLAKKLGISYQTLYKKVNNVIQFKCNEIYVLANLLNLSYSDIDLVFFN